MSETRADGGYLVPVSFEFLIDTGQASPLVLEWQRRMDEERAARWAALSPYTRFMRSHVWPRWYETRNRLTHAVRALRGIECERDD